MSYVDAYVGLCTAAGTGTATELIGSGYQRQSIAFNVISPYLAGVGSARAMTGRAVNATSITFQGGSAPAGTVLAGRAIYDAPTAGNLLLVLPFGSGPRTVAPSGPVDFIDATQITLEGASFTQAFSGQFIAGATLGTCYDAKDIIGPRTPAPGELQDGFGYVLIVNRAVLSCGVSLVVNRGVLQSASSFAAL